MEREIILECGPMSYYHPIDEEICFKWLEKVSSLAELWGRGTNLFVPVKAAEMAERDARNLTGIFARYGFDMGQLSLLKNGENNAWFDPLPVKRVDRRGGRGKRPSPGLPREVTLTCAPLYFHTPDDEELFFMWLGQVPCIDRWERSGEAVVIVVSSQYLRYDDLQRLRGLFDRYGFDHNQLRVFANRLTNFLFRRPQRYKSALWRPRERDPIGMARHARMLRRLKRKASRGS